MKKTISIHLAGFVFNIEEDAYTILQEYLDKIRQNLSAEEGCDEIMEDIEMRIAELFQERISTSKQVITHKDLEEIMEILGHPIDFASEDETNSDRDNNPNEEEKVRRLFRDRENGTLGGVCSGLGHYFDIDPLIFRIIFAVLFLFFGSGILLYIVLMIFIPEAKTTADKLEMRGKPVNLDSIKTHFNQFTSTISDKAQSKKIRSSVKNAVDQGIERGRSIFEVISKIIGVGFTVGGLILFILFTSLLFTDTGFLPFIGEERIPDIYTAIEIVYPGENWTLLIYISIILVILIPIVSFIITGVRIITKNRTRTKELTWTLSILWTVSASIVFINSIGIINNMKERKTIKETIMLDDPSVDVLYVDAAEDLLFSNYFSPNDGNDIAELIRTDENSIYTGVTGLTITSSMDTGNFELILFKHSRGKNDKEAIEHSERIDFQLKSEGNTLLLPPYIRYPKTDKIRGQYVSFTIVVPKGKSIKFGPRINRLKLNKNDYDPWLEYSRVPHVNTTITTDIIDDTLEIPTTVN